MPHILCTVDQGRPAFEAGRITVDVVCAGDSLTGCNNFGPHDTWPYRTYPDFLREMLGLHVANGGIAGEISDNGGRFVLSYMRHTDKWFRLPGILTADECLDAVESDWNFQLG